MWDGGPWLLYSDMPLRMETYWLEFLMAPNTNGFSKTLDENVVLMSEIYKQPIINRKHTDLHLFNLYFILDSLLLNFS